MILGLITSWRKTHCYFRSRLMGWILLLMIDRMHSRKYGPSGAKLNSYGSRYSMSRTCGPRDIISFVIPRIGDNSLEKGPFKKGEEGAMTTLEKHHHT